MSAEGKRTMSDSHMQRAFEAFSRISPAVAEVSSIDDLLSLVAKQAAEVVGVERCSVYLREDRQNLFRGCAGCSGGAEIGEEIKRWIAGIPADGLTRELLETRRPVIVANARQDHRMIKATVRHWKIRSIMEVPMISNEEIVGLLLLDDVDAQHAFT